MNEIEKFCLQILIHCSVGLSGAALRPCRSEGQLRRRKEEEEEDSKTATFADSFWGCGEVPLGQQLSRLSYQIAV
jgi:hypothetical protein